MSKQNWYWTSREELNNCAKIERYNLKLALTTDKNVKIKLYGYHARNYLNPKQKVRYFTDDVFEWILQNNILFWLKFPWSIFPVSPTKTGRHWFEQSWSEQMLTDAYLGPFSVSCAE